MQGSVLEEVMDLLGGWLLDAIFDFVINGYYEKYLFIDPDTSDRDALNIRTLFMAIYSYGYLYGEEAHETTEHIKRCFRQFKTRNVNEDVIDKIEFLLRSAVREIEPYFTEEYIVDEFDLEDPSLPASIIRTSANTMVSRMDDYLKEGGPVNINNANITDISKLRVINGTILSNLKFGQAEHLEISTVMHTMFTCIDAYLYDEDEETHTEGDDLYTLLINLMPTVRDYIKSKAYQQAMENRRDGQCNYIHESHPRGY